MSLGKVLVVDDDNNICELLKLYLEKEGYGVMVSHDGDEAVVKFNALKPDIVLLDIMLPGLDGWQVCREIRKKSNVPIIMITAKSETFDPPASGLILHWQTGMMIFFVSFAGIMSAVP